MNEHNFFNTKKKCPKCGKLSVFIGYDCENNRMYECPKCGIFEQLREKQNGGNSSHNASRYS
jgi:Zn ribbon nucleic-acid-binding protein